MAEVARLKRQLAVKKGVKERRVRVKLVKEREKLVKERRVRVKLVKERERGAREREREARERERGSLVKRKRPSLRYTRLQDKYYMQEFTVCLFFHLICSLKEEDKPRQ